MTTNHEVAGSNPAVDAWWERPAFHARVATVAAFLTLRVLDTVLLARSLRRLEHRDGWGWRSASDVLFVVSIVAWNARVASERARRTVRSLDHLHETLEANRER